MPRLARTLGMSNSQLFRKIKALPSGYRLRNFSAFDLALNHVQAQPVLSRAV
jgi:hypothetical protein